MKRKKDRVGPYELQQSLFVPESDWTPPSRLPNLDGTDLLGIDTETRDPGLLERGPGFIRGEAEVVGISVATVERAWYFPFGHLGGGNMDRGPLLRWLADLLRNPGLSLIGAHLQYDIEGLDSLGIPVSAKCFDVQIADALLDEELPSYSLDAISKRHLGVGKDEALLREASSAYGCDPKADLWKLHSRFVGPYGEWDARSCVLLHQKLLPLLRDQGLLGIYEVESRLLPIIYQMRKLGVRIDLEGVSQLSTELRAEEDSRSRGLLNTYRIKNVWSGADVAGACDRLGLGYPRTGTGLPSFTSDWLATQDHPFFEEVRSLRQINRLRSTYIDEWFKNTVNGRIHPNWHQLKRDEGGTRTGRMASSNPNAQQVPARSEMGARIRKLFIPEEGKQWLKADYSQQEPRILVHYAARCGFDSAQAVCDAYTERPDMDIYQHLAESCKMSRKDAKDATLCRCYGMGAELFASKRGISTDEAKRKLEEFDATVPFARQMAEYAMHMASSRGYIRTIGGRRRHFNFWEPMDSYDMRRQGLDVIPVRHEAAREKWPGHGLKRAYTHKALNSLIQGSAADMTKLAMLKAYEDHDFIPHLQVHDELDYSISGPEDVEKIHACCANCVEMKVPIKVDLDVGETWK